MTEEFLQYIWKHKLFEQRTYKANTGDDVRILHPGEQNFDAGPDFINAKIRIGSTLWAGNCEIHLAASDWAKHGHTENPAYNNVVLHVVLKNDSSTINSRGDLVPTIELVYNTDNEDNYKQLLNSDLWVPCAKDICNIERFHLVQWLTSLAIERLETRSNDINQILAASNSNWEEAFYFYLARSFGFKVNALPFEMLAKSLPLNILAKHKNNLTQIEALLFGQAGFLKQSVDEYSEKLLKEYDFLKKKYNLKPIENHLWKFLRLRPVNFPTVRIAQFSSLIYHSSALFSKLLESNTIDELEHLFKIDVSEYWMSHYKFGSVSKSKTKNLATDSIRLLLVNAVIPFMFIYGKNKNITNFKDKALSLLESIPPEKNSIIENWQILGVEPCNAFETQALLQLKNEYCNKKRCLACNVGNRIISNRL